MMNLRKIASDVLYEIASAITQFADAITPSSDEVWRERRWRQYGRDVAKAVDGPPITGTFLDGKISSRPATPDEIDEAVKVTGPEHAPTPWFFR